MIAVCGVVTFFTLSTKRVLGSVWWVRRAKVTKNVPPRLQYIGASRPGLSIGARIKMKMEHTETGVVGHFYTALDGTISKQRVCVSRTDTVYRGMYVWLVKFRKKMGYEFPLLEATCTGSVSAFSIHYDANHCSYF